MTSSYYINVRDGVDQTTLYSGVTYIVDEHLSIDGFFRADCTDDQVSALRSHSDVTSVEPLSLVKSSEVEDSTRSVTTLRSNKPSEVNSITNTDAGNWGLVRHTRNLNTYADNATSTQTYTSNYDGTGVDIIFIAESMVNTNNSEYKTDGASRIEQYQFNGLSGLESMENINYSPSAKTTNHAEAVLAIACSNTYGWATGANIYIIPRDQISNPVHYFEAARQFHLQKATTAPTLVFASYGYAWNSHEPIKQSITFRGNNFTEYRGLSLKKQPYAYGGFDLGIPSEFKIGLGGTNGFTAISTAAQALSDAGVITVYSAGNESQKCDRPGGIDYNNKFVTQDFTNLDVEYFPNRGSAQWATDSIIVGNLASRFDSFGDDTEELHFSSNRGDRVDTLAAGSVIRLGSEIVAGGLSVSGTSFSCPQIAGMAALVLEKYPSATPYQMRRYFRETAKSTASVYSGKTTVTTDLGSYGDPTYFNDGCALQGFTGGIAFLNTASIPNNPTTLFTSSGSYTYTTETTTTQKVNFTVDVINSKLSSV